MCRLFGLHAGLAAATATFWLLDAPDSLAAQSHRNPDGTGIGVFNVDRRQHGDVRAGITTALEWVVAQRPVYSVNFVLTTRTDLWALRYPTANELWILEQGGSAAGTALDARTNRIHARSVDLGHRPSVILASEPMTDDPH